MANLAAKFGVHRTTLDNLIKRLELTREDPDAVPLAVKDAIVASYRAGETLAVISNRYGFSPNKVQRLLVVAGEPIRARGPRKTAVSDNQIQQMAAQYERGEAIATVAVAVGVSYAQARGCLLDAGVSMRPRGGARR